MSVFPFISAGFSNPIRSSMVGAISAKMPSRSWTLAPTMQKGTGLVVWAVMGDTPSSWNICSLLPWSAVMRVMPPILLVASTT